MLWGGNQTARERLLLASPGCWPPAGNGAPSWDTQLQGVRLPSGTGRRSHNGPPQTCASGSGDAGGRERGAGCQRDLPAPSLPPAPNPLRLTSQLQQNHLEAVHRPSGRPCWWPWAQDSSVALMPPVQHLQWQIRISFMPFLKSSPEIWGLPFPQEWM